MTSDLMTMARAERADLAEFLATLTAQDWAAPTLCTRWNVKDVVAHVVSYEELGALGLLGFVLIAAGAWFVFQTTGPGH